MLLAAGEQISIALLSMAIIDLGGDAISLTGAQAGIRTDTTHGQREDRRRPLGPRRRGARRGQGRHRRRASRACRRSHDTTTLGRGGSDTTAVALAAALGAEVCEIYTDVEGVFTADPRIVPEAVKRDRLSYEEMLELAASGARVLAARSVEYARRNGVPIHVRSTFSDSAGTWIREEEAGMEHAIISGIAHDTSEAKVTIRDVPDQPGHRGADLPARSPTRA